jgi:large subunit ribosomal protein L4|tara:strand:- start:125 stop:733 length:609 start_codon:yes stop_codon:yes gene_type:complete
MEINILPNNEKINLSDACFGVDYKKTLVHQVITSYFSNGRENYSSQKNRSDVRGGGKKPWKQKGTGRARAGTTRGPIWRGGGVTFASGTRNYAEKVNKKMYNGAMRSIMSELLRTDKIVAIDKIELSEIKTKEINNILKSHDLNSVLIVTKNRDEKLEKSARNIKNVGISTVDYLDPPMMLSYKKVLIVKEALIFFEERYGV